MRIVLFLLCLNYVGVYSRNYVIHLPKRDSGRRNVMYKIAEPQNNLMSHVNDGTLEIRLIKETVTNKPDAALKYPAEATTHKSMMSTLPTRFDLLHALKPETQKRINHIARNLPAHFGSTNLAKLLGVTRSDSDGTLNKSTWAFTKRTIYEYYYNMKHTRQIAYKEDLDKMMNEKRIRHNPPGYSTDDIHYPIYPVAHTTKVYKGRPIKLDNIGEIVQLLKGVKVEDHEEVITLLNRYINTIHQLTNQFPNKIIELQLEINAPMAQVTAPPYRRNLPMKGNSKLHELKKKLNAIKHVLRANQTSAEESTINFDSTTISTTEVPSGPEKEPIYIDYMRKVFAEFERTSHHAACMERYYNNRAKRISTTEPYQSQDLLKLIGKGIQAEFNVSKPEIESDFDWLQVKMPNEE